jgi:DNA-3-methyladenine glycosylase I
VQGKHAARLRSLGLAQKGRARQLSSYCEFASGHPLHGPYHDHEYGFPLEDESGLFERLLLEINQAGLNWELMLKKREGFRAAYDGFDVDRVADYGEGDRARLLADPAIVRNRLKVDAAIVNAQVIRGLRDSHGGFAAWLRQSHPRRKAEWVKLFRRTFRFTGGEITGEFLASIGYLPSPHRPECPVYGEILKREPPWLAVDPDFWS